MRLATAEDTRTLVELMADYDSEAAALAEVRLFRVGLGVRAVCVQVDKEDGVAQSVYKRTDFVRVDRELMTLELASPSHVVTER